MSVEGRLQASMPTLMSGLRQISADGNTLGDCLNQIIQLYPQLKNPVFGLDQILNQ